MRCPTIYAFRGFWSIEPRAACEPRASLRTPRGFLLGDPKTAAGGPADLMRQFRASSLCNNQLRDEAGFPPRSRTTPDLRQFGPHRPQGQDLRSEENQSELTHENLRTRNKSGLIATEPQYCVNRCHERTDWRRSAPAIRRGASPARKLLLKTFACPLGSLHEIQQLV